MIGNKAYAHQSVPPVEYALNDAAAIKQVLVRDFGYREGNILSYENASIGDLFGVFGTIYDPRGRLSDYVKPNISDVFVYYSGHGAPDVDSRRGYLLPVGVDPSRVALTAYPLDWLYTNLSKVPARSMTVVIDACFSGASQAGSLLGPVSPVVPSVDNPLLTMENAVILTAARGDQVSTWYPDMKHGLFTHFLLKAFSEEGDANHDGRITLGEVRRFVADPTEGVPYWARRLHGADQQPQVSGDDGVVIVAY